VLGLVLMASAGTASAAHAPANSRAELRTALEHLLSHWRHTNHATAVPRIDLKQVQSTNWSGYADTGRGVSSVTGKWTEPTVTGCSTNGAPTAVVFWVGIDGFGNNTVEQGGTGAICGSGTPLTYFTWWEMFPTNAVQAVGVTVRPGDHIAASVVRSGTSYKIKVTDSTTAGNSFSTTQSCSTCANGSAEWIGERPSFTTGLSTLPKFSTWTLSSATVKIGSTSGTIKTFSDNEITMINNRTQKKVLAQPSALNSTGNSFKDVWKASS